MPIAATELRVVRRILHASEVRVDSIMADALSRAERRVNFAVIVKRDAEIAGRVLPEITAIMARAAKRVLGTDDDLRALIDDDPSDVATIALSGTDVSRVRTLMEQALAASWQLGAVTASNELAQAGLIQHAKLSFASLRGRAGEYLEANGFRMAENVSEATRSIIQSELLSGIRSGKSVTTVRAAIWDRLVRRGLTSREAVNGIESDAAVISALNELWVDDEQAAAHYLDTLVRTNMFEAMNEARFAEFNDPVTGAGIVAIEYSAILDERTTELCKHLHGRIYRKDSPVWEKWRPPNHFNSVPASTLITTQRGRITIDCVSAGDMVLTHRSRYRPVYTVMRKPQDQPSLLAVVTDSGRKLRVTHEHPVLTSRGWKRSDELQVGDVLFQHVEDVTGMGDVPLINPNHFPSLFDQPLVPYEVVSSTLGTLMSLSVKFERDAISDERVVSNVAADDVLELVCDSASVEDGAECALGFGRLPAKRFGLPVDDAGLMRVPRVSTLHAGAGIGARLAERPMTCTSALSHDLGQPIRDRNLVGSGSHGDPVSLARVAQSGLADSESPLDLADGLAIGPMPPLDQMGDRLPAAQVYHRNDPCWIAATIISIDYEACNESLWNLAVLDDESYVADDLIVHNCRSVLIPITVSDGWDGVESTTPRMEPMDGFTKRADVDEFHRPGGHDHDQSTHGNRSGPVDHATAESLADRIKRDGGFTYLPVMHGSPDSGFVVSLYQDRGVIDSDGVTPDEIQAFADANADLLYANPENAIGAWFNPENGKVYLDVSRVVRDADKAIDLAEHASPMEEAVYDLKRGETVWTPAAQQSHRAYLAREARSLAMAAIRHAGPDRGVDPQDLEAEILELIERYHRPGGHDHDQSTHGNRKAGAPEPPQPAASKLGYEVHIATTRRFGEFSDAIEQWPHSDARWIGSGALTQYKSLIGEGDKLAKLYSADDADGNSIGLMCIGAPHGEAAMSIGITLKAKTTDYLEVHYLAAGVKGKHVGSQLIEKAFETAAKMRRGVALWSVKEAEGFYEAIGGEKVGYHVYHWPPEKVRSMIEPGEK